MATILVRVAILPAKVTADSASWLRAAVSFASTVVAASAVASAAAVEAGVVSTALLPGSLGPT